MKILGSSKVDGNGKMALGDGVAKAMGVRRGDSVLFSKELNETDVNMVRAEGTQLAYGKNYSSEMDFGGVFSRLRTMLMVLLGVLAILLAASVAAYGSIGIASSVAVSSLFAFSLVAAFLSYVTATRMRSVRRTNCPISVSSGSPYALETKDRLRTAAVYVDDLFGASPSSVVLRAGPDGAEVSCVQVKADGYSIYRAEIPVPDAGPKGGSLHADVVYRYLGKSIEIEADFDLLFDGDMPLSVTERCFGARLLFDDDLNRTEFDDVLFDPSSGGSAP